jgi:hypothetical protein
MRISVRNLILFQLIYTFVYTGLIELLPILSPLKYVSDILIVILLVCILKKKNKNEQRISLKLTNIIIVALFLSTFLSYAFHYENFFYFCWGLRNLFKYFIFWYACIFFLRKNDFYLFAKILLTFVFVNTIVMFYQGAILQLYCDNVGGLWGTKNGVNGFTNILLIVSNVIVLVLLSKKRATYFFTICIFLCSFIQAAVAELKFYFIEFSVLMFLCFIFSKNRTRLMPLMGLSFFLLSIGFSLMIIFYAGNQYFFTLDSMLSYSQDSYAAYSGGVDRATAFPLINAMFLTSPDKFLFGIGLGNAEFTTLYAPVFIQKYEFLHIYFFSHGMLFLETGIIGLVLYCLFFISIFAHCFKLRESEDASVALVLSLMVFFLICYNPSMRIDSAFLVFAFLSFPYITSKFHLIRKCKT